MVNSIEIFSTVPQLGNSQEAAANPTKLFLLEVFRNFSEAQIQFFSSKLEIF